MRTVIAVGLLLAALPARADVIGVTPSDDLRALLAAAQAGDEFVLAAGTYDLGATRLALSVLAGSGPPVVVRSAPGSRAVLSRAGVAQAVLVIESSTNVVLRGLAFVGGRRGVDIVASDQVTIEDCVIRGAAGEGVAATTGNGTVAQNVYEGLTVRGNDIHGNGAGVVLGCGDGAQCTAPVALVRDNWVHDSGGSGIAVLGDASGSVIERNAIWSVTGAGVAVTRGVVVRNNIVIAAGDVAVRSEVGSAAIGALRLLNNTLVGATGLALGPAQGDVVVANNAVYASGTAVDVAGNPAAVTFVANIGSGALSGVTDVLAPGGTLAQAFVDVAADGSALNALLRPESPLIGAGDSALQPADDFAGRPRAATHDAGALSFVPGDEEGEAPPSGGLGPLPPRGSGSGVTPGPAKSEEGCSAAGPAWPLLLAFAVHFVRKRRPDRTRCRA